MVIVLAGISAWQLAAVLVRAGRNRGRLFVERNRKMPTIICSYCEYVGQGELYVDRIADVEEHEENCPERPTGDADLCGRLAKGDPDSI